ncbi:recombinase family protein [Gordonia sp. (in: high G+C Gram-positive bacteria)]|uniref:recombinase family protein n=1 Tax=Gordonia sp. (in: high G+C Gram-positive bacteria) TaxID=84139 RepID=UPI0039E2C456
MSRAVIYLRVSTKDQARRGGEAEGFSIPAQREACTRKAEQLGAEVTAEFIDAGESARSSARPELQRMLESISRYPVDYVIVHKVDRLARNRFDDVTINLAIQKAGAKLISVTENIDETPQGMLMHGIMSSLAEFYSGNLATETKKGMAQKVRNGGTPGMVPFGYLNVQRRTDEGAVVRTVELDPDRAEHAAWIYEAYATGEWTMSQIASRLTDLGVTTLPRPKRPARRLSTSTVEVILKNRYYIGEVKFDGVWHPGNHPRLVDADTFQRVQDIRAMRVRTREKPQLRPHYLRGTVACGLCGEELAIEYVLNRQGNRYMYYYCLGRQARKNGCTFVATPLALIERLVDEYWQDMTLSDADLETIRRDVTNHIDQIIPKQDLAVREAVKRVNVLKQERDALLRAHYAGAVPIDQLKTEQERISAQLTTAEATVAQRQYDRETLQAGLDRALTIVGDYGRHYAGFAPMTKRQMNKSVFDKVYIRDDTIDSATLDELFELLLAGDLAERLEEERSVVLDSRDEDWDLSQIQDIAVQGRESSGKGKNPRPDSQDAGSNYSYLVAGAGFEPTTSGL